MITKEMLEENLSPIIEDEYDERVIVLFDDGYTRKTVLLDTFVRLFGEADFSHESLTQEKYKPYRYDNFFDEWKEKGYIE